MSTPVVDLSQTSILVELIVRGGNSRQHDARAILQDAYQRPDELYPDVTGLSTLFRPHASLDELAREGQLPNAQLSWSLLGDLIRELRAMRVIDNPYRQPKRPQS